MFFSEGEIKKLPRLLQQELELFYQKYEKSHQMYDGGIEFSKELIKSIIFSLELYFKWENKVNKKIKNIMEEAVGNIPLTIELDKIELTKKLSDIINPLIDIIDSNACLEIDRKKFIKKTLYNLKKLDK